MEIICAKNICGEKVEISDGINVKCSGKWEGKFDTGKGMERINNEEN